LKLRTFIVLELPKVHKDAILQHLNRWRFLHSEGINWVAPENLHLTLLFIGDTQGGDLPALKETLSRKVESYDSFSLRCLGFELFPAREPKLLWAKLQTADQGIYSCAKDLKRSVQALGYSPDVKPLKLHITVGRIKSPQSVWLEREFLEAELPSQPADYDTVTFYQSILRPEGPLYLPLEQYTMQKKHL